MRIASVLPTLALVLLAGGTALARPHKRAKRPKAAPAAGSEAEGRSHLKKANALASHNDCEAAIEEYTQAFDRLNDPAVLLARADCRQKIGQNAEAAEDYRAYLDESPDVANRADIEAKIEKIAALEGAPAKAAPAKAAPAKEPAVRESAATREPPPTKEAARPKETARPPESAPAPAPMPPPVPPAAEAEASPGGKPLVGAAVVTREGSAAEPRPGGGHGRLWLVTALAVLVAGGAVTAGYFYFRPEPATPPATSLGNYRF